MSEIKHGLAWSDEYKLGNIQVDTQHRRLFELVSDLIDSCLNDCVVDNVKDTLDFLVNYTVQHFLDEEALQLEYNYPDYVNHRQLHEDFKHTIGILVREYMETGSSEILGDNINKTVVRWLINHIQREDRKIAEYIRGVRMGTSSDIR